MNVAIKNINITGRIQKTHVFTNTPIPTEFRKRTDCICSNYNLPDGRTIGIAVVTLRQATVQECMDLYNLLSQDFEVEMDTEYKGDFYFGTLSSPLDLDDSENWGSLVFMVEEV